MNTTNLRRRHDHLQRHAPKGANAASLPVGGTLTISGGTLDLFGENQSVGVLSGTSGTITNNYLIAATSTLTVNFVGTATYGGQGKLDGTYPVALAKQGTGTLVLAGANN